MTTYKEARTEQEFKVLAEFLYQMFCEMYPEQDWSDRKDKYIDAVYTYYRNNYPSPNQINYLAYENDIPVGSACAVLHDRPPYIKHTGTKYGYVHNVFVVKEYRGEGIAKRLMSILHCEAIAAGAVRLGLHTTPSAKSLYTDMGYAPVEKYLETEDMW